MIEEGFPVLAKEGGINMNIVTRKDVNKLREAPICFALMMEDHQIEDVIVAFVSVLHRRKQDGGGKD